jgi:tetratricopeptide (TPR) repeat protein
MHDAVISELAQAGVPVIARTSVLRYRDTERTVREIARELGVDAVIEGSVLRAGDSVRIQAQLIDGNTEEHLWAQTYEGDLRDVLSLHRQVTRGIARQIRLALTPQAETRLASPRPVNPEAYEAYLKGRYHWNRRTEEGLRKGADYFRQAIEKDPASALGYTGLADCLLGLGWYGFLPPGESVFKAKAAALKALEIDEALAEAHNSLAYSVLFADWDWARSEREFKRALELNPRYPTAHHWYADYLSAIGRHEEAIASAQRAHGLDPLSLIINAWVGWRYYLARRYDEAIEHYQRTLELDSTFVPTYLLLGMAYQQTGRHAEGLNQLRKAVSLSGGSSVYVAALARGYAAAGNSARTARLLHELNRLSKERYVSAYWIAQSYGGLGDKERAFQWLDKAYRERSTWLPYLNVDPTLDSLRPDPRFSALLRKVGLARHEPE